MHAIFLQPAENEMQHIEEMHADIGGNATGVFLVALPALQIPVTAGGNVGQVHLMLGAARLCRDLVTQGNDCRVHAQLQDGIDAPPSVGLDLLQSVNIPWIEHQWFFTDRIRARSQGKTHMAVMQVVGRAD